MWCKHLLYKEYNEQTAQLITLMGIINLIIEFNYLFYLN